jgi:hypothetical protein
LNSACAGAFAETIPAVTVDVKLYGFPTAKPIRQFSQNQISKVVYGVFHGINFQQSDIHFRIGTDEFCFKCLLFKVISISEASLLRDC